MKSISAAIMALAGGVWYVGASFTPADTAAAMPGVQGYMRFAAVAISVGAAIAWLVSWRRD